MGLSGVGLGCIWLGIKNLLLIIGGKINSSLGFDNKDCQTNKLQMLLIKENNNCTYFISISPWPLKDEQQNLWEDIP